MKPIAIIAIIAAVVVVGGACAGVAFSGVLNGGTTGPGGDDPVVPTEPVEPTPTETPTETPTDSSMSYFSPMTSSSSSSSGSGSSTPVHTHTWGNWVDNEDGTHSRYCTGCDTGVETEDCTFGEWSPEEGLSTHVRLCTVCSYEEREACDSDGCKQSEGETREHTLGACETCGRPAEQTVACLITYTESTGSEPPQHTLKCEVCEKDYGFEACSISTYISNDENPTMVETCGNCDYEKSTPVVAKIGDEYYETLEDAINAVLEEQTIEIICPGTYDPFTIEKKGVTVKGINTGNAATSTVIKNTATKNLQAYADSITLDSLYIDSTTPQTITGVHNGAIDPYITPNSGTVAQGLTVTNCYLEGPGDSDRVILYCAKNLTFTNNIVKNFARGILFQCDNSAPNDNVITGNTFEKVPVIFDGYWGVAISSNENGKVTITNNKVIGDEVSVVQVWDYVQWINKEGTAVDLTVSGNIGNIDFYLTHFDYITKTEHTVSLGEGQQVIYRSTVSFDIPLADMGNYVITEIDGSAVADYDAKDTLSQTVDSNPAVYALSSGDYLLVNTTSGVKYPFTVNDPDVTQQYVKLDTAVIANADDMVAFEKSVNEGGNNYVGKTVKLMDDIDLSGIDWTPIGQTGATQFQGTFDGNDKTISNLKVDTTNTQGQEHYSSGLFGWLNMGTVKNLTIDNADITALRRAGAVAGYLEGGATVENCKVTNSKITGKHAGESNDNNDCGDKVGAIVGYMNSNCKVTNCVAENCKIYAGRDAGQIVGAGYTADVTGCSATNVTVENNSNVCKGGNINEAVIGRVLVKQSQ